MMDVAYIKYTVGNLVRLKLRIIFMKMKLFFGVYVALLTISNEDGEAKPFVIMESGDLFIKIECQNIIFYEV